jgi:very-short-patch-repair endonuclease
MRGKRVERHVAEVAARQYGVVNRAQLLEIGLSAQAIDRRLSAGRLHRVHRGVYAVGHPLLSRHGHWLAAVMTCGPGAALSHAAAAALWEIRGTAATRIDVSVPVGGGRRARRGLRIHRRPALESTTKDGIPVTTVAWTLFDLAATRPQRALERAIDQAEIQDLLDLPSLAALVCAHPGRAGAAKLRAALNEPTALTRSALEERMLEICRRHGLPAPRTNSIVEGFEVDFHFERHRLVVETDGWRYHRTRRAFDRDRERDAALTRAGLRVLRLTDRQLADGGEVAATIRAALRSSG